MQQVQPTFLPGTLVYERYKIESLLGKGGFSAVYLVSDTEQQGKLFALKELTAQDKHQKERFALESAILQRLKHPALPAVYTVFEDNNRAYMLMEYIEGENLEAMRKRQPQGAFSLPEVYAIMAPIFDAVTYLHTQQPPIIHRDIKPANIVVSKTENRVVLVDFGLAKEYDAEDTTTAVRYCSPGYGAPEQYSNGTDTRTDIYALGATCYALLSGNIPTDALQRATRLACRDSDPLTPLQEILPALPISVGAAIQCAMAIGSNKRFANVEVFWNALQLHTADQQDATNLLLRLATGTFHKGKDRQSKQGTTVMTLPFKARHFAATSIISWILLVLVVCASIGIGAWAYLVNTHATASYSAANIPRNKHITTTHGVTATAAIPTYPTIAHAYGGTVHDLQTNTSTTMRLVALQQNTQSINGIFTGLQMQRTFTGVLDSSRHILFTLPRTANQEALFFEGTMRPDGQLVGNYCRIDSTDQCVGSYGIWSVKPM